MKKAITLTLITLSLSGCFGGRYVKPGGTQAQYDRDLRECQLKYRATDPAFMLVAVQQQFECMELEKGWEKEQ